MGSPNDTEAEEYQKYVDVKYDPNYDSISYDTDVNDDDGKDYSNDDNVSDDNDVNETFQGQVDHP